MTEVFWIGVLFGMGIGIVGYGILLWSFFKLMKEEL